MGGNKAQLFFNKEFGAFLIIGVINTFNGTIFSYMYSLVFNENLAFVFGYVSGLIIAYILNSFFVFKQSLLFEKFIRFCISYIPNFIIQNIVVIVLFNMLGVYKLFAYGIAAIIGIPITFLLLKVFAFKKV